MEEEGVASGPGGGECDLQCGFPGPTPDLPIRITGNVAWKSACWTSRWFSLKFMNRSSRERVLREALAEECDFGGRGIRARQWGRNKFRGPEVVRVKTGVCPEWYLLQSPVVDGIWPAASGSPLYLRSSYGVSLFLLYWRSANGMGADLPFLGQHCNYEAAQRRGWRCLDRCEGGWCALQCSLGSSQLIFHCCYTAENGLESIFLPTSSLLSPNPNAYFLCWNRL